MNLLSKIKQVTKIGLVFGVFAAAVSGVNLVADQISPASASTTCAPINVLVCGLTGGTTSAEIATLKSAYDNNLSSSSSVSYSFKDIKTIFNYVGANQTLVDSMSLSNTEVVTVYKNGDVKDSTGKLIATNASSVGRFNTTGSTPIPGTSNAYYRSSTRSFVDNSLQAIVRLDNKGDMIFGSIIECGNAFTATPVARPSFTISKQVSHFNSPNLYTAISVNSGDKVTYTITATNNGNRAIGGVFVKDALPANDTYVSNSLKRDGSPVASVSLFGVGYYVGSLAVGASTTFTFDAVAGANDVAATCTNEVLHNEAILTGTNMIAQSDYANVTKVCVPVVVAPTPAYQCSNISYTQIGSRSYLFNGQASASNGAAIKSYSFNFGDGTTQVVNSSLNSVSYPHDYGISGTFTTSVTVTFSMPSGSDVTAGGTGNCSKALVIVSTPLPPLTPVYQCSSISTNHIATNSYLFIGQALAANGATITGYSFDFGDGKKQVVNTGLASYSLPHDYTSGAGTFTATVTANFTLPDGSSVSAGPNENANCSAKVVIAVVTAPVPAAVCTNISVIQSSAYTRNVDAAVTYSAINGATLTGINFNWGDGNTSINSAANLSASHTYAANNTYNVVATLSFSAGSTTLPTSSCQASITVNVTPPPVVVPPTPAAPSAICTNLSLIQSTSNLRNVTATTTFSAINGAILNNVSFNWGDNNTVNNGLVQSASHVYQGNGTFTVIATLSFTAGGSNLPNSACQATLTFSTTTPPVVTPAVLVNTGPGSVAAMFAAFTAIGTFGYRVFLSRRLTQ